MRLAFDAANGKFGRIHCQRSKESCSRGKKEEYSSTESSESQSRMQNPPNELSENKRKGTVCWGGRVEKGRLLVKLVGDQNPGSEAPPGARECKRRRGKADVVGGAIEKIRIVGVIEE